MNEIRKKLFPFLVGGISMLSLFLINNFPNRIFVGVILLLWVLLFVWIYKRINQRILNSKQYLILVISTIFSAFIFLSLLEIPFLRWFLIIFIGISIGILTSAFFSKRAFSTVAQKTLRRIMVTIWVFNAYSCLAFVFAIGMFFPSIPFWVLNIFAGIVFGLISAVVWYLYYPVNPKYLVTWSVIIALIVVELTWVFNLLPFGFLASAFFVSWVWYIVQLLIRFHLSSQGVIWKKQILFLSVNGVLFFVLLYITRWV